MKDFINELYSKRAILWDQYLILINQLEEIEEANNLSSLRISISKLKTDVSNIDTAIKSLQSICGHAWDDGHYEGRYYYYTCKICGACKGDC